MTVLTNLTALFAYDIESSLRYLRNFRFALLCYLEKTLWLDVQSHVSILNQPYLVFYFYIRNKRMFDNHFYIRNSSCSIELAQYLHAIRIERSTPKMTLGQSFWMFCYWTRAEESFLGHFKLANFEAVTPNQNPINFLSVLSLMGEEGILNLILNVSFRQQNNSFASI